MTLTTSKEASSTFDILNIDNNKFHIYRYDKQINIGSEKSISKSIDQLSTILSDIGWTIDRSYGTQTTLEDFFS